MNVKWQLEAADGVLVVGTSLEVFSVYRFVDRAASLNIPMVIVNQGETRAERKKLNNLIAKIDEDCGEMMLGAANYF